MSNTVVIAPIRKSAHLECGVERAFRVFTAEVGTWWPLDTHAIQAGAVREVVWEEREGGEVYEISNDGEKAHWATVLAWEPPTRVVIAWHVNPDTPAPTEVEARFTPDGDGTRLDLEHRNWERLGEAGSAMREGYEGGWDTVLAPYVARLA
jgi:hypothetical protein